MGAAHTKCQRLEGAAYVWPAIAEGSGTSTRITVEVRNGRRLLCVPHNAPKCRLVSDVDNTVFCTTGRSPDAKALAERRLDCVHSIDGYEVISLFHFCDFDRDGLMYPPPRHPMICVVYTFLTPLQPPEHWRGVCEQIRDRRSQGGKRLL